MIAEHENALRVAQPRRRAESLAKERLGHGRDVLVRKPQIDAREEGVTGCYRANPELIGACVGDRVRRQDLLAQRHRAGRRCNGRRRDTASEALCVVGKKTAAWTIAALDGIETPGELFDGNGLAALGETWDERQVGARQKADVLGILPINLFDARRDDEPHTGGELAVRRLLA